jgi:multicomponent Na+:H+ antiporter subunit D
MMLVLSPLLVPLFIALLTAMLAKHEVLRKGVSLLGAVVLLLCAVLLLVKVTKDGRQSVALGNWPLPYAIEIAVDRLSAALVLTTALLGTAVLLYQLRWNEAATDGPGLHPLLHALLASAGGGVLAADLFNLYVWFELMFISVLGLLVLGGAQRNVEAAFKYFAVSMPGTLLLLGAVSMLYGATGQLNFAALREAALRPEVMGALPVYVGLILLALLLKAGAFPLFAWLPASYHTLPAPVLALAGGLLTKVAAYVLLRLLGDVFVATPGILIEALGWLAVVTMLTGVLGAAYHWDLRRIFAFHIISQVGYLLLGIALATPAAAAGTVYFLLHNILVKGNLFLIAGLMWAASGQYDLRRIGGLYPARPLLALLFLVNAFSLVGVPPTSGFWGKFLLLREAFAQGRFVWGGIALAVGFLTLYSMSKIWLEGFWKPHPPDAPIKAAVAAPVPVAAYVAVASVTLLILIIGIFPEPFIRYVETATGAFWTTGGAR